MLSFKDWLSNQEESSAFTRLRHDAALGLKPAIPAASIHSRSTASPFETKKLAKKSKAKKKKGDKNRKKKSKKFVESKKGRAVRDNRIDNFLNAVGALKDDTKRLGTAKKKPANVVKSKSKGKPNKCKKRSI